MRRAAILGMGQVSAVGAGLPALKAALGAAPPAAEWVACGSADARVPVLRATPAGLEKLADPRVIRRMDPFTQRALFAALQALGECEAADPLETGVIFVTGHGPVATTFGYLDAVLERGDSAASPIGFASSVHGAAAAAISSMKGLQGPMTTVTGLSFPWQEALGLAMDWLERGAAKRVVLVSGDEFHPVLGRGLLAVGGCAGDGRLDPLAFDRCTFVPGETFTAFVLGTEQPRYGWLHEPMSLAGAPAAYRGDVYLAAQGERRAGPAYAEAAAAGPVRAPAGFWGANPTAAALTVQAAVLGGSRAHCLCYEAPGRGLGLEFEPCA